MSGHAYAGELLFLYNGVRPHNVMPVHGTWRHLRANAKLAARSGVPGGPDPAGRERWSVDLLASRATISGAVPVGKMFVDGLVTGDVGDAALGERLIPVPDSSPSLSWCGVAPKTAAPPHLHSRGFSLKTRGTRTGCAQSRGRTGIVGEGQRHRPVRIAQAVRRTVGKVGGGDLPPPADDRAYRPRDLADPALGRIAAGMGRSILMSGAPDRCSPISPNNAATDGAVLCLQRIRVSPLFDEDEGAIDFVQR